MLENRVQGNDNGANPKHTVESDVSNRSLIVVLSQYDVIIEVHATSLHFTSQKRRVSFFAWKQVQ